VTDYTLGGIGYAHAMPRHPHPGLAPARQPKKQSTIQLRWESYWAPQCIVWAKREAADPADQFHIYMESYIRRVRHLINAGIAWTVITKSNLDSPLQMGTEFDRRLSLAIERRRCRMNRVKGEGKKYANRKRNRR
jgi:hypothetical protein